MYEMIFIFIRLVYGAPVLISKREALLEIIHVMQILMCLNCNCQKFNTNSMGMAAKLVKKALGVRSSRTDNVRSSRTDNEGGNKVLQSRPAPKRLQLPVRHHMSFNNMFIFGYLSRYLFSFIY